MKYIIVGPPRSGKSTYARMLRTSGIPTFCTDPYSKVKEPEYGVTYLPEHLDWHEGSQFVADHWMNMPGTFCIEGAGAVRAIRKFLDGNKWPEDMVCIRFVQQYKNAVTKPGQVQMGKSINTIWDEVKDKIPKSHIR